MKKLICAAAAAGTLILAGCQTPPEPPSPEPETVDFEKTLNPVSVREPSAEFYGENRAGAALRHEETAHVLWNRHYEPDPELERQRLAAIEAAELAKVRAAEEKAKAEALAAKRTKAKTQPNGKTKDRSIYAKPQPKANPKAS